MELPAYAELHCRSNFSFLTGASHPEELVERAAALGYSALAITDECSLAGVVRAHEEAKRLSLPLVIGTEMRLNRPLARPLKPEVVATITPADLLVAENAGDDRGIAGLDGLADDGGFSAATESALTPAESLRLVVLATKLRGYKVISRWISVARRRAEKGDYLAFASDVEGRIPTESQLAGLPDCLVLLVPEGEPSFERLAAQAAWLRHWCGDRAALAVELLHRGDDAHRLETIGRVEAATGIAVVAAGDVRMHLRSRKPLLDVVTAIHAKRSVAGMGFALAANAEAHLRSRQRIAALHRPEWLAASVAFACRCDFSLDTLRYEYPREIVPEGHTPASWLRRLTEEGAQWRYASRGGTPPAVCEKIEHELALIAQLAYEPYFLTVADIVRWARAQGILCQGRGSAANSTVCYCLGVTSVDPVEQSLLFERFLSVERNEPPDIDIDFEHQRREEVIQYIYRKYGRHRAALAAVVICYRPRSALRDAGRALGIDLDRIEAVSRGQHWFDGRRIARERLVENGFDPEAPMCRLWMELTQALIGFPRHLSQHPGGFVIAREHIADLVPVENATMDGRTVIQWDKDDLESLKLLKVDMLALGMLSAIRRSLEFVSRKLGRRFEMHEVPQKDEAVYAMLSRADSIGVFQVESRAQMSMLPRLAPKVFYDLVVEVAIVRPGPIQGGMVHPYLRRRTGEEAVEYPSDEVKQALERTLGVPIFQEQVMQLAILAADFTPGEADGLRRAMAAWKRKGGLGPFHERLVGRMVEKGYSRDYAERIFSQIEGFGEYGFPESHAASFALLVYVSAWLKHHHPDAFLAGLLNSQPMGFYAPAQLVRDARAHGVEVLPVEIDASEWDSVPVEPTDVEPMGIEANGSVPPRPVRLGFSRLSGLGEAAARRIVAARDGGRFASVEDLARRAALDARELGLLARGDALVGLAGHRHLAAWSAAGIDARPTRMLRETRTCEAEAPLPAPALGADLLADYRATGLSLKAHPLSLLRPLLAGFRVLTASELSSCRHDQPARASGLVTHRQRPETAKGVMFVTLEDETGTVNVIVWRKVVETQRVPLLASRLLTVYGIWQRQGEVRHLIARRLVDHTPLLQGLSVKSRDFH